MDYLTLKNKHAENYLMNFKENNLSPESKFPQFYSIQSETT